MPSRDEPVCKFRTDRSLWSRLVVGGPRNQTLSEPRPKEAVDARDFHADSDRKSDH
jgi:hypothetical protein